MKEQGLSILLSLQSDRYWNTILQRLLPDAFHSMQCHLRLYSLATIYVYKNWNLTIFSQIGVYLKNHWTNARLVCTYWKPFLMLNSNMAMKIWISKIFGKKMKILMCRLHSTDAWRGLTDIPGCEIASQQTTSWKQDAVMWKILLDDIRYMSS